MVSIGTILFEIFIGTISMDLLWGTVLILVNDFIQEFWFNTCLQSLSNCRQISVGTYMGTSNISHGLLNVKPMLKYCSRCQVYSFLMELCFTSKPLVHAVALYGGCINQAVSSAEIQEQHDQWRCCIQLFHIIFTQPFGIKQ